MGDNSVQEQSWSFVTLARIKPVLRSANVMQYKISNGTSKEYSNQFQVLELEIPEGADPGLVHYHTSGFIPFTFNRIFDMEATQEDIFCQVQDMIIDIFEGINSTILAYGQTGSGKTYSMCGGETFEDRGLIPRTINLVFEELDERRHNSDGNYKCLISFTEVFGEAVYDLLDPMKSTQALEDWSKVQITEGEEGLTLRNINVFEVSTEADALNLFFMGTTNRATSSTPMNHASSRSHAIFTIVVESECKNGDRTIARSGKVNLVDLAGSERLYKVDNSKTMIREGKSINLSLHFLEQVIVSLRDQAKRLAVIAHKARKTAAYGQGQGGTSSGATAPQSDAPPPISHIPYRNSVLTNILRDSLGGNCKSCFLITMTAEEDHFEETVSTARFGQRCGEIQVKVRANVEVDLNSRLLEAQKHVKHLEHMLSVIEEERAADRDALEEKTLALDAMNDQHTRPLSEEEEAICQTVASRIVNSMQNEWDETSSHPSPRLVIAQELSGLRAPMVTEVVTLLVTQASELVKATNRSNIQLKNTLNRYLLNREMSVSTVDSKDDTESHTTSRYLPYEPALSHSEHSRTTIDPRQHPQQHTHTHPLPHLELPGSNEPSTKSGVSLSTDRPMMSQGASARSTIDPSNAYPSAATAASLIPRDSSGTVVVARKAKFLVEGATVISHGSFGNYKVKYCYVSKDMQLIYWKDMFDSKDPKVMRIDECDNFHVEGEGICNRVKTPGGVMLSFTDSAHKVHEFEFPCQSMTPEENEKRVNRWVELLMDLKEGKRNWIDSVPPSPGSSHMTHSAQHRSTQLVQSKSQSVANIGRYFGLNSSNE